MLYLLFPKGNIEAFLEKQNDHANLSIDYLKSILLYHPDNIDLNMILMEKYAQTGEDAKALELNHKLIQSTHNKKLLTQLYKIEYLLEKTRYFKNTNPQKLQALKNKLLAYYQYTKENRDYLFFFSESSSIDDSYLKYHSLKNFMEESPEIVDYELEKMAFDLANKLGYKEEAYLYLQKLIKYPQLSSELKEYLVYALFERNEFTKARTITTEFLHNSHTEDERTQYFYLTLHALVQDPTRKATDVSQLIQDYANVKTLHAPDIVIILNTLLELGDSREAANFAINMFYANPENFDETGVDLALKSLLYNTELQQARALSFFAEAKFKKEKYLDKTIQLSSWLGESEAAAALNQKGYETYHAKKYAQYFLDQENLNRDHEILGEIYKDKIDHQYYVYVDNLAKYYEHTGEINQAEQYFTQLYQETKQKKVLYYAIAFSYKNSHFKKGLRLYAHYQSRYGIDAKLHELSIQKLLALKAFEKAYAYTKALTNDALPKKQKRFSNLAWFEKDYAYLHQKFWEWESKGKLSSNDFDHFIILEKALNKGKKIDYLYQQAWKKNHHSYHLSSLLYKLLQEKKLKQFNHVLNNLSKDEKKILHQNIDFLVLLASYHTQNNNIALALKKYKEIFKLAPTRVATHQAYLWFLIDNHLKYPELNKEIQQHLQQLKRDATLQEQIGMVSIIAAMSQKKHKLAKRWVHKLLRKAPKNKQYLRLAKDIQMIEQEERYVHYDKILNPTYLNTHLNLKRKHLGSVLSVNETSLDYEWRLYQNIRSKIMVKHYQYTHQKRPNTKQTLFEIALKNEDKRFLWNLKLGHLNAKKDLLSAAVDLSYTTHNFQANLKTRYQNKSTLTPQLEQNALEDAVELQLQTNINHRSTFSFLAQKRDFTNLNGIAMGKAQKVQLNANYILRSGYPDIAFNSYLSHNQFSKNIAQDFSEFGISSSIGTARQHTLNSSWKPFGSLALAINDGQNLGGSLTFGVSKMLTGDDSLDVLFDYYNGIGVISEPIYGLNVRYRF